ncbi:MAG: hypothetical protein IT450_20100 [Phycisphaerales bacterium]|nr:hypothetical protein [Phycisphaerales bacterium]
MSTPTLNTQPPYRIGAWALLMVLIPLAAAALVLRWPFEVFVQAVLPTLSPFEAVAIDGPFQMFNALRRLEAGQTPGVDFQYFHGIGHVYLHYPVFAWLGRDVFASEYARDLLSPLLYAAAVAVFGFAATRRFGGGWVVAAFILIVSDLAAFDLVGHDINPRSLRCTAPIFAFAIMLSKLRPLRKAVLMGCATALAAGLGTEHALALVGATVVVQLFVLAGHWRRASVGDWLFVPVFLAATVTATGLLFVAMGHGFAGAAGALRYALVETPRDQFWYFGTPPNAYVGEWADLFRAPRVQAMLLLGVPAALWALERAVRCERATLQGDRPVVAATMLIYSLAASIGYLGIARDQNILHVFRTLAMAAALFAAQAWEQRDGTRALLAYFSARPLLRLGGIALCAALVVLNVRVVRLGAKDLVQNPPRLGPLWQNSMRAMGAAMRDATPEQRRSLWSTYGGMLEARLGIFPPAEDYIILALGPERRRAYLEKFRELRPHFVQTIDRGYTSFEEWLQNTSWDFYEDVLNNYTIVANTAYSLLWRRTESPWREAGGDWTRVPRGGDGAFTVPFVGDERYPAPILVVQVKYTIRNPLAAVPVLGATPRCFVHVKDASSTIPVCVAPYEEVVRFPVVPRPGKAPRITSSVRSLVPGVAFEIKSVEFRVRDVPLSDAAFIKHLPPWTPPDEDDGLTGR